MYCIFLVSVPGFSSGSFDIAIALLGVLSGPFLSFSVFKFLKENLSPRPILFLFLSELIYSKMPIPISDTTDFLSSSLPFERMS